MHFMVEINVKKNNTPCKFGNEGKEREKARQLVIYCDTYCRMAPKIMVHVLCLLVIFKLLFGKNNVRWVHILALLGSPLLCNPICTVNIFSYKNTMKNSFKVLSIF